MKTIIVAEDLDAGPAAWTQKLREYAKAEGLGEFRPGYWEGYELTYEHNDYLRSIGRLSISYLTLNLHSSQ